jgi:Fe-S cluster assembly protein SufD
MPNYLQTEFEKVLDREYFSKKVHPLRRKAFSDFIEKGLPDKKCEDWRFTDLSAIKKGNYRISEMDDGPKNKADISKHGLESFNTIVIYNGHLQQDLSSIPEGVKLLSNLEYMEHKNWKVSQPKQSSFDLLNTAFMDSGISLIIQRGIEIETPLRILFICSGDKKIMISPRIHIDLEESSSMTLLEQHVGDCDEYLYNGSIIMDIEDNARLEHIRIQNNSETTINMGNLHVRQHKESNFTFNQFAFGGRLGRINLYADLIEQEANCILRGLSLSNDEQHLDAHIITNHHAPYCTSSQNFKSILKDRSSGVFNGRSIVQNRAEKTDSNQSNKNLLLSKDALMNSNPQLEIYTDDVKCSHGSSTGALEPDALFYIRSRGLDQVSARALLVRGFASEIIEALKDSEIRDHVTNYFDQWIDKNN